MPAVWPCGSWALWFCPEPSFTQLLSVRYELQSYGSVGSSKSPEGTENELVGSAELGGFQYQRRVS